MLEDPMERVAMALGWEAPGPSCRWCGGSTRTVFRDGLTGSQERCNTCARVQ